MAQGTLIRTLGRTGGHKVCYVPLMILAAILILFEGTGYSQESQENLGEVSKDLTVNAPVAVFVAKTTKIGKVPVKFLLSIEYSSDSKHSGRARRESWT